jgi:hypothetical protein
MTSIPNRGLRNEIEQGEISFTTVNWASTSENPFDITLEVGSNPVRLQAELSTVAATIMTLYDTPTTSPLSVATLWNQNLTVATVADIDVSYLGSTSATGTWRAEEKIIEGARETTSPFRLGNGIILKASTDYLLRVLPTGVTYADYNLTLYFKDE